MNNFTQLKPMVYRIIKNDKGGFNLKEEREFYTVKDKLYGPVRKILYRIDRLVKLKLFNHISILSTGRKGLGKTTTNNRVCNTLLENGIPVIEIKYLDIDTKLIEFMSNFRNVVIYIDEFGKYFNMNHQDKMLTLLNKTSDYYNVFLLGENEEYKISTYLLDRMERITYHLRHDRIAEEDLLEACTDYKMSDDMIKNLKLINSKSSNISYDTLEILSKEHKLFPELSFDELTSIMNCQGILGIAVVDLLDVQMESSTHLVDSFRLADWSARTKVTAFTEGSRININIDYGIVQVEKPETEKPIETPPPSMPSFGMPYPVLHSGNKPKIQEMLSVTSDDITNINDLDGVITCEVESKVIGTKLTIIIGSKLVPK